MSSLKYEKIVKDAHRQRNREIWNLVERLIARLTEQPKLRS